MRASGRDTDDVGVYLQCDRSGEPPPASGAKIRADFIDGMGKINCKFVIILNIQRVLSVDEIASLAVVSERAPGLTGVGEAH